MKVCSVFAPTLAAGLRNAMPIEAMDMIIAEAKATSKIPIGPDETGPEPGIATSILENRAIRPTSAEIVITEIAVGDGSKFRSPQDSDASDARKNG